MVMIKFTHNPVDKIVITSPFGYRIHPITGKAQHHSGNDLAPKNYRVDGDNIYSVASGVVVVSKVNGGGVNKGFGYYVIIDHGGWISLYGHLTKLEVKAGQSVRAGQIIGHMGTTGTSTGTHLHFAIYNTRYRSEIFEEDSKGVKKFSLDPSLYYIEEEVAKVKRTWEEIIKQETDSPESWYKGVALIERMAADSGNLGDLEIFNHLKLLIEKLGNK